MKKKKMIHYVKFDGYCGSIYTACGILHLHNIKLTSDKWKVTCKNCRKTEWFRK